MDPNFFTTYVQPCLAPGVALIGAGTAAYIAWRFGSIQARIAEQQARTARNKLRLDLFEKRMKVYEAIAEYLNTLPSWAMQESRLDEFLPRFAPARWLFGPEVMKWVEEEMLRAGLDYVMARFESARETKNIAMAASLDTQQDWALEVQRVRLVEIFTPYLKLEDGPMPSAGN